MGYTVTAAIMIVKAMAGYTQIAAISPQVEG
jgi:hypothetical protein